MTRIRAAVILANELGEVALIERRRAGLLYYVFPGGGVEDGEDPRSAAIREAREELGIDAALEDLVAEVTYGSSSQYYFRARQVGGVFGTGSGPELGHNSPTRGATCPFGDGSTTCTTLT